MHTPLALLKFVAKALGNALGGGVAGDVLVEVLPAVARDVWGWWHKDTTAEQRRAEVEALAQAGEAEMRQQVAFTVQEVASDKPLAVRQVVETYLTGVPASIRRTLRRPSDPTGTTAPASLVLQNSDDLLRLLPPNLPRFKPGDRPLSGADWELVELLGRGGFGEVWKARNPHLPSMGPVALKFCLDPASAKVLENEAAMLDLVMRRGKHPGIVQLLRTYLSAQTPCLEYEYVEGGDLTGLFHEWHQANGGPSWQQAAKAVGRLAEIVGFAHRLEPPIVHRDLKPANVLVQRSEGEERFKVADFGIGGVAINQAIRQTSRAISALHGSYTPLYASPQQMRGEPPDPRDDVYSLGVIWHQLLTGDLTAGCPGGSLWRKKLLNKGVPPEMVELLERCFEDDLDARPLDASVLAGELNRLLPAPAAAIPVQPVAAAPVRSMQMYKVFHGPRDPWGADEPSVEERQWAVSTDNPKSPFSKVKQAGPAFRAFQELAFSALGRPDHSCREWVFVLLGKDREAKQQLVEAFAEVVELPFVDLGPDGIYTLDHVVSAVNDILTFESVPLVETRPRHFMLPPCILYFVQMEHHVVAVVAEVLAAIAAPENVLRMESGQEVNCDNACWIIDIEDMQQGVEVTSLERGRVVYCDVDRGGCDSRTTVEEQEVNHLIAKKDWLSVAKHPYFLYVANPKMLTALIGKLEAMPSFPQGSIEREAHEFAVAYLRSLLKKRERLNQGGSAGHDAGKTSS